MCIPTHPPCHRAPIANGAAVRGDKEVTDPIWGRLQTTTAPAEWRLLGWLEREGYAYDLYAEAHLHDGTLDLDRYRILMLNVHPEYWSARMVCRVKAWIRERGGRLMYLGGNGLYCEVEFLDAGTLRFKTFVVGEAGSLGMPDPNNPTVYLESRMHRSLGESEASLLGVVTTEAGIMTAAAYRVVAADHWAFAGTGLRAGDAFGAHSMQERVPGGASGHKTDKMSASSPPNRVLLAQGLNAEGGGAHLIYYETPGGGAVFSAGSITYPACLLVDRAVSHITSNVIGRFLAD